MAMAKNKPQPKPLQQTVRQPGSTTKPKASGSWFRLPSSQNKEMLFDNYNYILMAISGLLIIIGFILMSGGNQDPKVFKEEEIYSFRRITLAPVTVVLGFIVMIFAILKKPAAKTSAES